MKHPPPAPAPRLFNRSRAVVSLFWKIQWEKEAVSSALTSALSLCQESGWPGRGGGSLGGVQRKPAAGGPRDVRLPHGSQGRGLWGEEQGLLETHSGARAHTCTGSCLPTRAQRPLAPHRLTQTRGQTHTHTGPTRTFTQSHTGLTKSVRDVYTPALSKPHTGKQTSIDTRAHTQG